MLLCTSTLSSCEGDVIGFKSELVCCGDVDEDDWFLRSTGPVLVMKLTMLVGGGNCDMLFMFSIGGVYHDVIRFSRGHRQAYNSYRLNKVRVSPLHEYAWSFHAMTRT